MIQTMAMTALLLSHNKIIRKRAKKRPNIRKTIIKSRSIQTTTMMTNRSMVTTLGTHDETWSSVSGVNDEPNIIPNTGIKMVRIRRDPRTGAPDSAAPVVKTIAPIIQASGMVNQSKIRPPIAPRNRLASM